MTANPTNDVPNPSYGYVDPSRPTEPLAARPPRPSRQAERGIATPRSVHPARWSPAILDAIEPWLTKLGLAVHDPYAGTGERLGALCDRLGLTFTGTEIQPEFIVDLRVDPGDSTLPLTYPATPFVIVTSPVYPSGMADHFRAQDGSKRHTYRQALAEIRGHDTELHPNNMGRWGVRRGRKAVERHFDLARRCIHHWSDDVIVNVSDFIYRHHVWALVDRWHDLLTEFDYQLVDEIEVETPRQRNGANGDLRVDHETILVAHRKDQQ